MLVRNFNFVSERLICRIMLVFYVVMFYIRLFITVYLIHMHSNITNLSKAFFGSLISNVIEVSRLIPKFST